MISADTLKGYILEEVLAWLMRGAGYRLLTHRNDDPHDLDMFANGLVVRGRGGYHQADVLGELVWAPAFGNPIRLFLEAKWRGIRGRRNHKNRVGVLEVRHAVGIVQDVNQMLSTISRRADGAPPIRPGAYDYILNERLYSFDYRYALFSTLGFTKPAQAYALAHQINLIDLSNIDYGDLLISINSSAEAIVSRFSETDASNKLLIEEIRAVMRESLSISSQDAVDSARKQIIALELEYVLYRVRQIRNLFVGVTSTGFILLLKADRPEVLLNIMASARDPYIDISWPLEDPLNWSIAVYQFSSGHGDPDCNLTFSLPEYLLDALNAKADRAQLELAIHFKEAYFSRVTVVHVTEDSTMMCSLKINLDRLRSARDDLRRSKGRA